MIHPNEVKKREIAYIQAFHTLREIHRKYPTSQEVINYMAFILVSDIEDYTKMIVELEKLKLEKLKLVTEKV